MLSHDDAERMLRAATFRLHLGQHVVDGALTECFGTGFFVGSDGLALTAYHNFEGCSGGQIFVADYKGATVKLTWIRDQSSENADIAVMRLHANPSGLSIDGLRVAYLDPLSTREARENFFKGRSVTIFGYPVRDCAGVSWRIDGVVDDLQPVSDRFVVGSGERLERLCIRGLREYPRGGSADITELEGISGAAGLDLKSGCVVAVDRSYDVFARVTGEDEPKIQHQEEDGKKVTNLYVITRISRGSHVLHGSEIAGLVEEHPTMAHYFELIVPPTEPTPAPPLTPPKVPRAVIPWRVQSSVLRVGAAGLGYAFVIEPGFALTCLHLVGEDTTSHDIDLECHDRQSGRRGFKGEYQRELSLPSYGLAVVTYDASQVDLPPARLGWNIAPGQTLYAVGFAANGEPVQMAASTGSARRKVQFAGASRPLHVVELDVLGGGDPGKRPAPLDPGMSGAPWYDPVADEVVAVVVGLRPADADDVPTFFGIPLDLFHLLTACRRQVRSVTTPRKDKYDPSLYVKRREIDGHFDEFLAHRSGTQMAAAPVRDAGRRSLQDQCVRGSHHAMFLWVDRAGAGKTNSLFHFAEERAFERPTLLFDSAFTAAQAEENPGEIAAMLEKEWLKAFRTSLRSYLRAVPASLGDGSSLRQLQAVCTETLGDADGRLVVVLDALNENVNKERIAAGLLQLVSESQDSGVRFVVSCRDLYWGLLSSDVRSGLYNLCGYFAKNWFTRFTTQEFEDAFGKYTKAFGVTPTFRYSGARRSLYHPLLLRIFFSVFEIKNKRPVIEAAHLHLYPLFEDFLDQKISAMTGVALRTRGGGPVFKRRSIEQQVRRLVTDIGAEMLKDPQLKPVISWERFQHLCSTGRDGLEQQFLDEYLLIESTGQNEIGVSYDELGEFLMAQSYVSGVAKSAHPQADTRDFLSLRDPPKRQAVQRRQGVLVYILLGAERVGIDLWGTVYDAGRVWRAALCHALAQTEPPSGTPGPRVICDKLTATRPASRGAAESSLLLSALESRARSIRNAGGLPEVVSPLAKIVGTWKEPEYKAQALEIAHDALLLAGEPATRAASHEVGELLEAIRASCSKKLRARLLFAACRVLLVLGQRALTSDDASPILGYRRSIPAQPSEEILARMVVIPRGRYWRGSTPSRDSDSAANEAPARWMSVDAFLLDREPTTREDFRAFVREWHMEVADPASIAGNPNHPVTCVNWWEAALFCLAHGKRLPTETEWEKAARGGETLAGSINNPYPYRQFPWGDKWEPQQCRTGGKQGATTTVPVGATPADVSPYGITGFAGNVKDWCGNWLTPYDAEDLTTQELRATGDTRRAVRGGAWDGKGGADSRVARRDAREPATTIDTLGFRGAVTACSLDQK